MESRSAATRKSKLFLTAGDIIFVLLFWSEPRLVPHLKGESVTKETDHAQEQIHRRTDHRDPD